MPSPTRPLTVINSASSITSSAWRLHRAIALMRSKGKTMRYQRLCIILTRGSSLAVYMAGVVSGTTPPQKDEGWLQGTISTPGAMLTSEGEADEKLREMNETFLASLEGLGGIEESIRRKKTDSPESPGRESPTRLGMEGLVRPRYGSAASQGSGEVTGCLMMFAEGQSPSTRWARAGLVFSSIYFSLCSRSPSYTTFFHIKG